jgi:hypothetical protein
MLTICDLLFFRHWQPTYVVMQIAELAVPLTFAHESKSHAASRALDFRANWAVSELPRQQ